MAAPSLANPISTSMERFFKSYPSPRIFSVENIDGLDGGQAAGSDFQEDILALVLWWRELQETIALHRLSPWDMTPEEEKWLQPAVFGLKGVMSALADALTASVLYHLRPNFDSVLELIRRYRVWTVTLRTMAKDTWPHCDWSGLDKMV